VEKKMDENILFRILDFQSSNLRALCDVVKADPRVFLRGSDFTGADLRGTDLRGFSLRGAEFSGALLDDLTILNDEYMSMLPGSAIEDILSVYIYGDEANKFFMLQDFFKGQLRRFNNIDSAQIFTFLLLQPPLFSDVRVLSTLGAMAQQSLYLHARSTNILSKVNKNKRVGRPLGLRLLLGSDFSQIDRKPIHFSWSLKNMPLQNQIREEINDNANTLQVILRGLVAAKNLDMPDRISLNRWLGMYCYMQSICVLENIDFHSAGPLILQALERTMLRALVRTAGMGPAQTIG
jgi:uncharacterized protein YjbI with pentapeptide repeats